jgi:L-threonylcarbamoyladenylate synthase
MSAGPEEILIAVDRLKKGVMAAGVRVPGVVAFPTETVYGLGASAKDPAAVARVFALKGRPATNPLIVHVSGEEMARTLASPGSWTVQAQQLAAAFWPGPLTIIVPKGPRLPLAVTAGGPTVAVRVPAHPLTLALIEAFGGPLVGPSANKSGHVSPTTAQHVREAFGEDEVFVLDGGPCARGLESTVVDLSGHWAGPAGGQGGSGITIRRLGPISASAIERVLGLEVAVEIGVGGQRAAGVHDAMPSPGLLDRHYAPRTPARLFASGDWAGHGSGVIAQALAQALARDGVARRAIVLTHTPLEVPSPHERIVMPGEAQAYAARLYAALHEADQARAAVILIESVPATAVDRDQASLWHAIADRLRRATG